MLYLIEDRDYLKIGYTDEVEHIQNKVTTLLRNFRSEARLKFIEDIIHLKEQES